jgi:hypothetical protein
MSAETGRSQRRLGQSWQGRFHGKGDMMMLEKNSDAVAARIENWVDKALPERAASR